MNPVEHNARKVNPVIPEALNWWPPKSTENDAALASADAGPARAERDDADYRLRSVQSIEILANGSRILGEKWCRRNHRGQKRCMDMQSGL